MHVAERREARRDERHVGALAHDDAHVDDGLGREARHRSAAHVFHGDSDVLYSRPDPRAQPLEDLRPRRVVLFDNNSPAGAGNWHCLVLAGPDTCCGSEPCERRVASDKREPPAQGRVQARSRTSPFRYP